MRKEIKKDTEELSPKRRWNPLYSASVFAPDFDNAKRWPSISVEGSKSSLMYSC
jgi:hypothetical protein